MLHQRPHEIPRFLRPSGILQQPLHNPLLDIDTARALAIRNLDQTLKKTMDGKRLGLLQRETLPLFRLKRDIPWIAIFGVQRLQTGIVEAADFLQRFRDSGTAETELEVDVRRRYGVCSQPNLVVC